MSTDVLTHGSRPFGVVWAFPFRPFFLATAIYAVLGVVGWLGILLLGWPLAGDFPPMQWHSHEMLFGMVPAAIAGFLLTAMCNWTGAAPLSGWRLGALFALWLAGRVAMWMSAVLPHGLIAFIDLSFLAVVALYAAWIIIGTGNFRNLPLVFVVTVLWLANALFHAGLATGDVELLRSAELATIGLITLLMVVIGGRITPAFTRNWLLRNGRDPAAVVTRRWVETLTIATTLALIVFLLAGAPYWLIAPTAAAAALFNGLRLFAWSGWQTHSEPLLWILHVGYAWIPLGLALLAVQAGTGLIAPTVWLHALGPGAMGILIIGVMTRVSLGHTGRTLELVRGASMAYWLIIASAVLRILTAMNWILWDLGILSSTLAWVGAFAMFLWFYVPILTRPRADGRPG